MPMHVHVFMHLFVLAGINDAIAVYVHARESLFGVFHERLFGHFGIAAHHVHPLAPITLGQGSAGEYQAAHCIAAP